MGEREHVVVGQRVTYEGLFLIDELHKTISSFLVRRGYDITEKMHSEVVKPEGKHIDIELEPERNLDDYSVFKVRIRIYATGLKDVTVEQDGRKRKMNRGKAQVVIDAWLELDTEGRFDTKPIYTVMRRAFAKFVYKSEQVKDVDKLKVEMSQLKDQVSAYFNLHKFR